MTEKQEREIWRGEKRYTKSERETRERDLERREEIYEE